jgi:hypothetical protein
MHATLICDSTFLLYLYTSDDCRSLSLYSRCNSGSTAAGRCRTCVPTNMPTTASAVLAVYCDCYVQVHQRTSAQACEPLLRQLLLLRALQPAVPRYLINITRAICILLMYKSVCVYLSVHSVSAKMDTRAAVTCNTTIALRVHSLSVFTSCAT